jgi:DNA primase
VQSTSAAGKSALMEAVLAFVPEEERLRYSAMTGQSLYYLGQTQLKHKILAIAEEEGVRRASYALKLLQSEGELTMASTGKDPATGNLVTQEYRVEGPVMIFLTTTAIEIDEELLNRCLVLSVDEGREQTQAIHRRQRERRMLDGLLASEERTHVRTRQQNAQRLLRPLAVVNPYADQLTFMDDRTRTRRDHEKYLTLIDTITLLYQYQRPIRRTMHRGREIEYIEVTLADIAQANALAHDMLGRSLDELPPQTRRLLQGLCAMVATRMQVDALPRSEVRFSRREARDATAWGDTQLRVHLERLVAMEYLLVHRGQRGQSFVYELLYDGDGSAAPYLSGLIDAATMATSRGSNPKSAGPSRAAGGINAAPARMAEMPISPNEATPAADPSLPSRKTHLMGPSSASHLSASRVA